MALFAGGDERESEAVQRHQKRPQGKFYHRADEESIGTMLCYAMLCYAMLCDAMLCYAKPPPALYPCGRPHAGQAIGCPQGVYRH
jgi:hypothetical protein